MIAKENLSPLIHSVIASNPKLIADINFAIITMIDTSVIESNPRHKVNEVLDQILKKHPDFTRAFLHFIVEAPVARTISRGNYHLLPSNLSLAQELEMEKGTNKTSHPADSNEAETVVA